MKRFESLIERTIDLLSVLCGRSFELGTLGQVLGRRVGGGWRLGGDEGRDVGS